MRQEKAFEVSVIVFREDDAEDMFAALALEMSVRGYGPTPEDAIDDLIQMLHAQISFALQMGHPESVWQRAEDEYWQMFEAARRDRFVAEVSGADAPLEPIADMVPLSLIALKSRDEWIAARGA